MPLPALRVAGEIRWEAFEIQAMTFWLLVQQLVTRDSHMTRAAASRTVSGKSLSGLPTSLGVVYVMIIDTCDIYAVNI